MPDTSSASKNLAVLLREAQRISATPEAVLITGAREANKELLAQMIHEWSGRTGTFVAINCATLADTLIESQLFGQRKTRFASAVRNHPGAARQAADGTLFLDEIDELSTSNQGKLLRLIERGEVHSIGAQQPERIDVRVIAATTRNLKDEVAEGLFRRDLFYSLRAHQLKMLPHGERAADLPDIAKLFVKSPRSPRAKQTSFMPQAVEALRRLPHARSVGEWRAIIEGTRLKSSDESKVAMESMAIAASRRTDREIENFADSWAGCSLTEEVRRYEGALIRRALGAAGGSVTHAARLLGITHQGLAFILSGRHKELGGARKPVKRRRSSIVTRDPPPAQKTQDKRKSR